MALLCICEQYTVSPLISPLGGLFISNTGGGGRGEGGGCLIETVSYVRADDGFNSPKRTKVDSGKAQVPEVGGHAAEDQTQIRTCSW